MNNKYVARAEAGVGWRIFNRKTKRWWGNYFPAYPEAVLQELNAEARPEILANLCRISKSRDQSRKNR